MVIYLVQLEGDIPAGITLRHLSEQENKHPEGMPHLLAQWRQQYRAWLAAQRTELLTTFLGLSEETLDTAAVFDDYTPAEILAHIAAWDEVHTERLERVLAGREQEIQSIDLDTHNAALHQEQKGIRLDEALERLVAARRRFLETLDNTSDEVLHRPLQLPWGT